MKIRRTKIKSALYLSCIAAYVFLVVATLWLSLLSAGYRGIFLIILSLIGLGESIYSSIIFKKRFRNRYLEQGLYCFIFFAFVMTIISFIVIWY